MIRRRKFLLNTAIGAAVFPSACSVITKLGAEGQVANASTSLRDRAATKGLIYGAFPSVPYKTISEEDIKLRSAFLNECGLLVGGFYWRATRPSISTFNFAETDAFANFAASNNLLFRGHPLVWNQVLPEWLTQKFEDSSTSSKEIEDILTNHVRTIVRRYAGRVHSWDVVNEAIEPQDQRSDGLQKTPWLNFLEEDYIKIAFQVAAEADPNALLTYNDYGLEYDIPKHEARRTAVLRLLERLKAQGTPIHAFGTQSHLDGSGTRLNPKKLKRFLRDVASLGLKILVTELDVIDKKLPADVPTRDRIVAANYEDYLNVVLEEPAVIAVINWGLSDRYTWLSNATPRSDGLPLRPLPLDENMERKLVWNAIARSFDQCPNR